MDLAFGDALRLGGSAVLAFACALTVYALAHDGPEVAAKMGWLASLLSVPVAFLWAVKSA